MNYIPLSFYQWLFYEVHEILHKIIAHAIILMYIFLFRCEIVSRPESISPGSEYQAITAHACSSSSHELQSPYKTGP